MSACVIIQPQTTDLSIYFTAIWHSNMLYSHSITKGEDVLLSALYDINLQELILSIDLFTCNRSPGASS